MLSLSAKTTYVLSRTAGGADLAESDRNLVDRISGPDLQKQDLVEFEKLFEYVRQNNSAPKRWLFNLSGLEIDKQKHVRFEDKIVDRFNPDELSVVDYEKFVRQILYPACKLAKKYNFNRLSSSRIPFFINEILGNYKLQSVPTEVYEQRKAEQPPSFENEYGYLFGIAAIQNEEGEPLFQPFLSLGGEHFCCLRFLTVEQYCAVSIPMWIANLPDEKKAKISAVLANVDPITD